MHTIDWFVEQKRKENREHILNAEAVWTNENGLFGLNKMVQNLPCSADVPFSVLEHIPIRILFRVNEFENVCRWWDSNQRWANVYLIFVFLIWRMES